MPAKKTTVLTLARSGGVAGIRPPAKTLDTSVLPDATARRIEELLNTTGFFKLPAVLPEPSSAADAFQHSLTVSHPSGGEHTVTFTEASASEALRELKRMVRDLA